MDNSPTPTGTTGTPTTTGTPANTATPAPRPQSPKRIAAGRRNGPLARGRKSPAGLLASSANATSHGLRASRFSILPTENAEHFQLFRSSLLADLAPRTAREADLASLIIHYSWLLHRNLELENIALSLEIHQQRQSHPHPAGPPDLFTWLSYDALSQRNSTFQNLARYRSHLQRDLARAQQLFDSLKSQALPSPCPSTPVSLSSPHFHEQF